jgi:4'-phosphopantetheinyl transferase
MRARAGVLPAGVIDVWRITLRPPAVPIATLLATLDGDERAHTARLGANGETWAAARGALRMILAGYLGVSAETLQFGPDVAGKPRLTGGASLEFSVSHSDELALIAVASDRAVGADVERLRDDVDIDAVSRDFLSPGDAAAVSLVPAEQRREAFFAAWTRHEARLKLHGQPLDAASALPSVPEGGLVVTRTVAVAPGFAAAVAAEGGSWTVRVRDFPEPR